MDIENIVAIFCLFIFVHHSIRNAYAFNSTKPLPIYPLLGGICGFASAYLWSIPAAWLALLLDVGCIPYLLMCLRQSKPYNTTPQTALQHAAAGCLMGQAIGDAMGLATEGLSKKRQLKMYPNLDRYGLLFGKGLCSDDTEHACMTTQALLMSNGDERMFAKLLAYKLRWWLAGLPAGIGLATLRACTKLWLGFPATHSGAVSAGNGPAMRAAIIGVLYGHQPDKMLALLNTSSRITHRDPRAEHGAIAIALAAYLAQQHTTITPSFYLQSLSQLLPANSATLNCVQQLVHSLMQQQSFATYCQQIGCEHAVSGYMLHTLPVVLHVWLRHPDDYVQAIEEIIRAGGDTDTTAAILGSIIGAGVGVKGIPSAWRENLIEWPRSPAYIQALGIRAAQAIEAGRAEPEIPLFIPGIFLRNILFMLIVLAHGFRRLAPPY